MKALVYIVCVAVAAMVQTAISMSLSLIHI